MNLTGENRSTREKTCPSATLSTTNPRWTDPGYPRVKSRFLAAIVLSFEIAHRNTVIKVSAYALHLYMTLKHILAIISLLYMFGKFTNTF
jgi:hypothetical protein